MIQAGAMRHSVRLEQRSTSVDAAGEQVNTWAEFATRRCSVMRAPGGEVFASAQRNERVPVTLELRWLDGVTGAMRAVFAGKIHDVASVVDPDGLGERLVLTLIEHQESA